MNHSVNQRRKTLLALGAGAGAGAGGVAVGMVLL